MYGLYREYFLNDLQKLQNKIIFKIFKLIIYVCLTVAKTKQSFSYARTLLKVLIQCQKRFYKFKETARCCFSKKTLLLIYPGEHGFYELCRFCTSRFAIECNIQTRN